MGTSKLMKVKRQAITSYPCSSVQSVAQVFWQTVRGLTDQHGSARIKSWNEQADEGQETSNHVVSAFVRAIRGPALMNPSPL